METPDTVHAAAETPTDVSTPTIVSVSTGHPAVSPLANLMRSCRQGACDLGGIGVCRQAALPMLVFCYLAIGCFAFAALERQAELQRQQKAHVLLRSVATRFTCSYDRENASKLLVDFLASLPSGATLELTGAGNFTLNLPSRWDYLSSLFFCMTVITTIGYGNVAPSTPGGQALCCAYAIVGIPLLAIFLGSVAARLRCLETRAIRLRCWRDRPKLARVCSCIMFIAIGFLVYFVAPAAMFTQTEGWPMGMGLYYCFITLSTIGFGDMIAGQAAAAFPGYKVLLSLWIYTGLIYVSGCIAAVQGAMEKGVDTIVSVDSPALELSSPDDQQKPEYCQQPLALQDIGESDWGTNQTAESS